MLAAPLIFFTACSQLRMERMRAQEAAADSADLQRRCEELQQQLQQQATAAQTAQQQAAEALQRAKEAADQVG